MALYVFLYAYAVIAGSLLIMFSRAGVNPQKAFWFAFFTFFLVWVFFLGFRHEVGTDYYGYLSIFDRVNKGSMFIVERFEPGFLFVNVAFFHLGLDGNAVLFSFYLASFLFLLVSIKNLGFGNATMISASLLLLIGMGPVFSMTNVVRQQFVVALSVFLLVKFYDRRVLAVALSSVVGVMFHVSAVVTLIYLLIPKRRLSPIIWSIAAILAIMLANLFVPLMLSFLRANTWLVGPFASYLDPKRELLEATGLAIGRGTRMGKKCSEGKAFY